MSTLTYRPLPAVSLAAALMAVTFGGCGCSQAPSSTAAENATGARVVAVQIAPSATADDARTSLP